MSASYCRCIAMQKKNGFLKIKEMWHLLCTHKRKRGLGSPELGPRTRTHSACPHYPRSSPLDPGPPYTSRKPIRPKLQRSQPTPRETIIPWDQQLKPSQEWSATTNCQGKAPRSPDCLCKVDTQSHPRTIHTHTPPLEALATATKTPVCCPGPETPQGG